MRELLRSGLLDTVITELLPVGSFGLGCGGGEGGGGTEPSVSPHSLLHGNSVKALRDLSSRRSEAKAEPLSHTLGASVNNTVASDPRCRAPHSSTAGGERGQPLGRPTSARDGRGHGDTVQCFIKPTASVSATCVSLCSDIIHITV